METFEQLSKVFDKYWKHVNGLAVMPNTIRARSYLSVVTKDITIEAILDNDKSMDHTDYQGIPVYFAGDYLNAEVHRKILVSSHYAEIKIQLDALGYRENIDYIDMHLYISLWYWSMRKEIHLLDVHTAITTFCSLNCRHCNMFINHYEKKSKNHMSLQALKNDFEALFQNVDYCYKVTILGGEPFLNPDLPQMILWLGEKYHDRIGEIAIVTNGTLLPSPQLIQTLRISHALVSISDYSSNVEYGEKLNKLIGMLEHEQIRHEINKEMQWKDFFFPQKEQEVKMRSIREHMLCCNPVFRGLNDKKFYYCHIVWSATQAGLLTEEKGDYISLDGTKTEEFRRKLLEHDLGFMEKGYLSLCQYCGGCGIDNSCLISAGEQENESF